MQQPVPHIDPAAAWDTAGRVQRLGAARAEDLVASPTGGQASLAAAAAR